MTSVWNTAEFVKCDDVCVIQFGQRPGFPGKALGEAGSGSSLRRQDLQGDDAVEVRLPRLVNGAHATLADEFQDCELRKVLGEVLG